MVVYDKLGVVSTFKGKEENIMITRVAISRGNHVYVGVEKARHHHVINSYSRSFFKGEGCIQGFVTDEGVFLDRESAARHAYECGQINCKKKRLFSEDLW